MQLPSVKQVALCHDKFASDYWLNCIVKALYFVSCEHSSKFLFLLFIGLKSFSNWKTTIYCILIMIIMIATNLSLYFTVTGSKMNGEMFLDLRRADLQDLFPSTEEFSFRKKIYDFLEDVVSKITQHEMYIMI